MNIEGQQRHPKYWEMIALIIALLSLLIAATQLIIQYQDYKEKRESVLLSQAVMEGENKKIKSSVSDTYKQSLVRDKVIVTSNMLNVRSGPGLQHYIANRVYYGDTMKVLQREADWLYVQLADNNRGWVMTRFTDTAQ